jgi:hypothetical protein
VIDHVAISADHAAITTAESGWLLEDLNSTNGTQVNGQPVKQHQLQDNDVIELPPYKIKFVALSSLAEIPGVKAGAARDAQPELAGMQVLSGPSIGQEMLLTKPLTTVGRPGVQVAVVTHRKQGYFIAHVEGNTFPLVNGESIGADARLLKYDDVIDLSGTRIAFRKAGG